MDEAVRCELEALYHLELLTDAEHEEWRDRLMGELPPTKWIGG